MKYLREFESVSAYNTFADGEEYVEPNVSRINEGSLVKYNKSNPQHDYSQDYLTMKVKSSGTLLWVTNDVGGAKTISYSKNNGESWIEISSTEQGTSINLENGDTILFKGDNASYYDDENYSDNYFSMPTTGYPEVDVCGNIMSLINSTSFTSLTSFTKSYAFKKLFYNCKGILDASNLILPATTLTSNCYASMFSNCISLTAAPELPATTLANGCYNSMFGGCTSLTIAPELNCINLQQYCYNGMFVGCTSLIAAPELPATTLEASCYQFMFQGCTNLNYIKCLATTISETYCMNWVGYVSQTGTFIKNPNMSSWTTGDSGIPTNWTVQDAS